MNSAGLGGLQSGEAQGCHSQGCRSRRRRIWVLGLLALSTLVAVSLAPLVWARPQGSRNERHIALLVAHLMDQGHLSGLQVNKSMTKLLSELLINSSNRSTR